MAHHKRKRPKRRRAGCLLCKPSKLSAVNGGVAARLEGSFGNEGFERVIRAAL